MSTIYVTIFFNSLRYYWSTELVSYQSYRKLTSDSQIKIVFAFDIISHDHNNEDNVRVYITCYFCVLFMGMTVVEVFSPSNLYCWYTEWLFFILIKIYENSCEVLVYKTKQETKHTCLCTFLVLCFLKLTAISLWNTEGLSEFQVKWYKYGF